MPYADRETAVRRERERYEKNKARKKARHQASKNEPLMPKMTVADYMRAFAQKPSSVIPPT